MYGKKNALKKYDELHGDFNLFEIDSPGDEAIAGMMGCLIEVNKTSFGHLNPTADCGHSMRLSFLSKYQRVILYNSQNCYTSN